MAKMRLTFSVARLFSGFFRRALRDRGLDYDEDKGFLTSHFVVVGDQGAVASFAATLAEWSQGD